VTLRVLIVGGGALGGVMAAKLTRAGHDVVVLDANAEHVARMIDPGIRVDVLGTEIQEVIAAVTSPTQLTGEFDFALITLKAPYIAVALEPLHAMGCVKNYVSLGNGLVQDKIASIVGEQNLLIGTVSWGATNIGPGHVAQTTAAPFSLGELNGEMTPRLIELGALLQDVQEVHFSDNIRGQVWAKLLLNSSFSGLGVVTGLVYGDVVSSPQGRDLVVKLWTEGFDVAQVLGIELDTVAGISPEEIAVHNASEFDTASAAVDRLMATLGPTKASMLQDVQRGVITEVDVINGGVASSALRVGAATPLNDAVVELVHSFERGEATPGVEHLTELAAIPLPK
jgi:2-dehydropantoate 2-reductase